MDYSRTAFSSSNGLETITPRQPGVQIGQRNGLSNGDIAAALALYSPDPDGQWSQWFGLGGVCSAVSVVRADDVTDIYVRGQDGTLFQKWWDGQRWNPDDSDFLWHGADFRMQPNSLSVIAADGIRDLHAIGLDGQLYHRFWTASGGWSQWFGLGGVCSGIAAVTSRRSSWASRWFPECACHRRRRSTSPSRPTSTRGQLLGARPRRSDRRRADHPG